MRAVFLVHRAAGGRRGQLDVPTLENGDKILVSNLFYKPKQGDIVVFRKDEYREEPLVKRIIAVEGQTVDIDFNLGIVYVDGEALDEPYIAEATANPEDFIGPVKVDEAASLSWATTATPPPTAAPLTSEWWTSAASWARCISPCSRSKTSGAITADDR